PQALEPDGDGSRRVLREAREHGGDRGRRRRRPVPRAAADVSGGGARHLRTGDGARPPQAPRVGEGHDPSGPREEGEEEEVTALRRRSTAGRAADAPASGATAPSIKEASNVRWHRAGSTHADEQRSVIVSPARTRAPKPSIQKRWRFISS